MPSADDPVDVLKYVALNLGRGADPEPGDPDLIAHVCNRARRVRASTRASSSLEITESFLIDDADASIATLGGLKGLGISLAVDDFGTGLPRRIQLASSGFPGPHPEIDKSFIDAVTTDPSVAALTEGIVRLAASSI